MRTSNVIAAVLFFAVLGYLGSVLLFGKYGIRQDGTITYILSPNDAEDCKRKEEIQRKRKVADAFKLASQLDFNKASDMLGLLSWTNDLAHASQADIHVAQAVASSVKPPLDNPLERAARCSLRRLART